MQWRQISKICTVRVDSLPHRKWKETKQQPIMLPGPAVPGCCLVSFHFMCHIHHSRTVRGRIHKLDPALCLLNCKPDVSLYILLNFHFCAAPSLALNKACLKLILSFYYICPFEVQETLIWHWSEKVPRGFIVAVGKMENFLQSW